MDMSIATNAPWEMAAARGTIYETLSLAFLYPQAGNRELLAQQAAKAAQAATKGGVTEIAQASQALALSVASVSHETLLEQYIDLFGHGVSKDCPQYECEYDETHIFLKSHTLAGLSSFYSAFGVAPNPELRDRLDHISVELEFMQLLATKEAYALVHGHGEDKVHLCQDAQKSFLSDHLAPWIKTFIKRVGRKTEQGTPYAAAVGLLDAHLRSEFGIFQIKPAPSHQTIIPLEMEDADAEECGDCPVGPGPL